MHRLSLPVAMVLSFGALSLAQACSSSETEVDGTASTNSSSTVTSSTATSSNGSGGTGGQGTGGADPISTFYDDFHSSRYSAAKTDAEALDAVLVADPTAGEPAVARGLAHLWHISELGRDPSADPSSIIPEAVKLLDQFVTARANSPDDGRVPCWLGLTQINIGRQTSNQALVDQGLSTIDEGVAAYPEFNLFCKALAYSALPASDPDFAKASEALFDNLDVCFGESVDRANPDITPYLGQATSTGEKRVCWNDAITPHGAEGFYLFFGDVLVKQGDVATAAIVYHDAELIAEYSSWPYKALLESRLTGDLDARAALYANAAIADDPPIAGDEISHGCTYCHAASADE